jgi:purine nucleosidase/pyrimidine-specific ribonucleoside hydrolase
MNSVLIDTDPGVDDALALLLAFSSPELTVEGITTVVGNVSLELANLNALKLLEFLGARDVPVASGAGKPLSRTAVDGVNIHGLMGLGEAVLPEPTMQLDERSAVQLIKEKAEELGDQLTIIPLGPLTNIASAIQDKPGIFDDIAGLVIMGGAFNVTPYGHGNMNAVAEYNIWHDPEAAKIVFDSGVPVKAVGLDVTTDPMNRLSPEMFAMIESLDTARAHLVADLCRSLVKRKNGLSLHDPLAVAVAVDPSLVETMRVKVEVETVGALTRGMTVVDRRRYHKTSAEGNVDVCFSVKSERFLELFMGRVVHGREGVGW